MPLVVPSADRQIACFIVTTVACALISMSTGPGQWRVWHQDDPLLSHPGFACVGMWRLCIHHQDINSDQLKTCHPYSYQDALLPPDIRFVQHLLLAANILGILGKGFIILSLRNMLVGVPQEAVYSPFIIAAVLNITASSCVTLAVFWNYYTVANTQGIAFPPSLQVSFKPNTQEVGSTTTVAVLAALLFFISATVLLSNCSPEVTPVPSQVAR